MLVSGPDGDQFIFVFEMRVFASFGVLALVRSCQHCRVTSLAPCCPRRQARHDREADGHKRLHNLADYELYARDRKQASSATHGTIPPFPKEGSTTQQIQSKGIRTLSMKKSPSNIPHSQLLSSFYSAASVLPGLQGCSTSSYLEVGNPRRPTLIRF